jgi:hypothetical protein
MDVNEKCNERYLYGSFIALSLKVAQKGNS